MILPIKTNTSINSYMHHTFISSILESKEILRFSIKSNKAFNWNYCTNNVEIQHVNNEYSIISQESNKSNSGMLYTNCTEEDDIQVHILYQRKLDVNSYIQFVIFQKEKIADLQEIDRICTFALDNYGFYYNDKQIDCYILEFTYIRYFKRNNNIVFSASKDGLVWEDIYEYTLGSSTRFTDLKVAIDFSLGIYTIELWKNMNFIQLFYSINNTPGRVRLDYFMFPKKNTDFSFVYPLNYLKTLEYSYDEMVHLHGSLTNFLIWCINHGFYIILKLDEYFLFHRKAYNNYHYLHDNMIYGYKEDIKCFCTLGFNNNVISCDVDYDIIENVCDKNNVIRIYKFDCNYTKLILNMNYIKSSLKEYLYGIDSSAKYANFASHMNGIYGLKIYKYLCETTEGRECILTDVRISYVMYEHNLLLKEKILFWNKQGCIDENVLEEIMADCDVIISVSKNLIYGVLRNKKNKNTEKVIFDTVNKLYDLEVNLYEKLLRYIYDE